MEKKYCDFIDEITADELYEGLLGYGMFANKLPPIFTSVSFYDFCKAKIPSFSKKAWYDYVPYSSMRNTNIPRAFGIPSPMKYQLLCRTLCTYWNEIKHHFHNQTDSMDYRVSRIHIRKLYGKKEIFEMNYKNWREDGNPETNLLLKDDKASKFIVKADISNCFPSIYSHSLPWALVGKEVAKANRGDDSQWYNKIDSACYALKNGETHGLLIGPFASNLLAEIILTRVDRKLYDEGYRYFRNIDDFECYVDTYEKAQRFLRDLEGALSEYDLSLNHKKTAIISLPIAIAEKWIHKLNSYLAITKEEVNYKETNAYLDLALGLANETGDSAVLKYAIKTLAGCSMTASAKKLASQRIIHMSIVYPYLVQMMEEFVFAPFSVRKDTIKEYADTLYANCKSSNYYEGVCYAINFSLKYDFEMKELDMSWVIERGDCVLLLMTWLYYLKLNHGNRRATALKPLKAEAKRLMSSDMDRYWLFCYEVVPCSDLTGEWKVLKKEGVSFIKAVL